MPTEYILLFLLVAAVLGLNVKATTLVLSDELSALNQKAAQLLLVWLLPIIGTIVVLGVHHAKEKYPGRYREIPDPGEDFGFPRHSERMGRNRAGDGGDDD
jgi:hypothetical protein